MMRALPGLLFACLLLAQEEAPKAPARKTYPGTEVKLDATCSAQQIDDLDLRCTRTHPCPIYLELSSAGSNGTRYFVAGNLHTEEATLASILLASEDSGKTWYEAAPRIVGAGLDRIQFHVDRGWVSGQILAPPPASDPFLLFTDDAGQNWRRIRIRGQAKPGLVDAFAFRNATNGLLLIDNVRTPEEGFRYELFESTNGGQTWNVKQYSNQLPADRPAAASDRTLLLRENAGKGSYELIDQYSNRPISQFAVKSGLCQPPLSEEGTTGQE